MKITPTAKGTFVLLAESLADIDFIGTINHYGTASICLDRQAAGSVPPAQKAVVSIGLEPRSDLLQTLLKLDRLLRIEPHDQRHVGADAVDPNAQERAVAILKKLNVVIDALSAPVSESQVLQKVAEAH